MNTITVCRALAHEPNFIFARCNDCATLNWRDFIATFCHIFSSTLTVTNTNTRDTGKTTLSSWPATRPSCFLQRTFSFSGKCLRAGTVLSVQVRSSRSTLTASSSSVLFCPVTRSRFTSDQLSFGLCSLIVPTLTGSNRLNWGRNMADVVTSKNLLAHTDILRLYSIGPSLNR